MAEITQIHEMGSDSEGETIRFTCSIHSNEILAINTENSRYLRYNEKYKPFPFKFNDGDILVSVNKISYNLDSGFAEITGNIIKHK